MLTILTADLVGYKNKSTQGNILFDSVAQKSMVREEVAIFLSLKGKEIDVATFHTGITKQQESLILVG
jgi:hypothetical protein